MEETGFRIAASLTFTLGAAFSLSHCLTFLFSGWLELRTFFFSTWLERWCPRTASGPIFPSVPETTRLPPVCVLTAGQP